MNGHKKAAITADNHEGGKQSPRGEEISPTRRAKWEGKPPTPTRLVILWKPYDGFQSSLLILWVGFCQVTGYVMTPKFLILLSIQIFFLPWP